MKISVKLLITAALVTLLAGCATPARKEMMEISATDLAKYTGQTPLKGQISISQVSGGQGTNPLWTSEIGNEEFQNALEASLKKAQLLADGEAGYTLQAKMVSVDQPLFGIDIEVTTHIQYTLSRKAGDKVVYDELISAPFTATMSDAFIAIERLKLANEGSARANIGMLIDKLYGLDPALLKAK